MIWHMAVSYVGPRAETFFFVAVLPRSSSFVAVAAAALGQRSSARVLEAGSSTCSCSTDRARARRATRCALTLGFREIDLWASVDGCCVPLLTTGEEETRASSRGAFCSLAVFMGLLPGRRPERRRATSVWFPVHAKVEVHRIFMAALLVLLTGGNIPGRVECMTNGRQAEDNGVGAYPQA